jgi:TFIIF-interacting CTD phosphatase-like protein
MMELEDKQGNSRKEIYISFRPFLFETLQTLKKHFELILFTAGFEVYANTIVSVL